MVLSTVLNVANKAGLSIRIIDENVGTGDNSNLTFDLDNDHVISGTLTLGYAASGSNTFSALTETTHYTINDYESGRITLTSAGRTALGTSILYASYTYLGQLTSAQVTTFITRAEQRVRAYTGKVMSSTSFTEYYDGKLRNLYPRTDRPFQQDRAQYDYINLRQFPVSSVDEVTILNRSENTLDAVYSYDGSAYTDNITEAGTSSGTAFSVYADATPDVNDAIYFGLGFKFLGVIHRLQTLGVNGGSLAVTWEYYNGSTWASLTTTASVTGADLFTASGKVTWTMPSAWATTSVNSSGDMYFVRARMSAGSYSTAPSLWEVFPDPDGVINTEISLRGVDVDRSGKLTFLNFTIPDGVRNLRITYTAGIDSNDERYYLFVDLEDAIAALMCAIAITGGSFDDETHFRLGEKDVTIGEVYVNVNEVVKQLQQEIETLLRQVGKRIIVV